MSGTKEQRPLRRAGDKNDQVPRALFDLLVFERRRSGPLTAEERAVLQALDEAAAKGQR
jgi:hypothetical protein